jgi:UDP-N-acetylmuramoylalanine--D-glutamate ligase
MAYEIGILGGGESGVGAALLAQSRGMSVFLSEYGSLTNEYRNSLENQGVAYEEGGHSVDVLFGCETIVKSPGIPQTASVVRKLRDEGITIISEIELASRYMPDHAKMIAITGSNGKTTTTNLIHHLLVTAGYNALKGGNLGPSFSSLLLIDPADYYVIEVSSFQLEDINSFKPNISLLLNVTPDHLDRYNYDFEEYANTKMNITAYQQSEDSFLYNAEDQSIVKRLNLGGIMVNSVGITYDDRPQEINNPYLKGEHNRMNAAFAIHVAKVLDVSDDDIEHGLKNFVNDAHRMQPVASIEGVNWINDSKATNVDSTRYALMAIDDGIIWIVGGVDKGNDYTVLHHLVQDRVKHVIALGVDNTKIITAFGDTVDVSSTSTMKAAIDLADDLAEEGDTVLLSPACASFDLFNNYMDRGEQFIAQVTQLTNTKI